MPKSAASRLVLEPYSEEMVKEAARSALQDVGGQVTIGFVFASADYKDHLEDFLELLQLHAHIPLLVGCSGAGLIGVDHEAEQSSGFSLLLLHLPETKIHIATLSGRHLEEVQDAEEWHKITGVAPSEVETWISLVDPFSFPVEPWLASWSEAYPGIPTIGGLCSSSLGAEQADEVFVVHNREVLEPGSALLIGFKGGVSIQPLLAQGCRPIGEPLTVTGTDGNLVLALGGKPAYSALAEAFEALSDEDKTKAQGNLFAGFASSEYIDEFKRGDFLIRTILGADSGTGAVAVGAYPRVGQTFQWQLRDKRTAEVDLKHQLIAERTRPKHPFASLVFSCNGRGKGLFGKPNHDAHALAQAVGKLPSAGLFCNGEIGPIGKRSFVHGYTVSMAFFE